MDKIILTDLAVETVIGTLPEERIKRQTVHIDAELACDMRKPGKTDNLLDAVDYSAVEKQLFEAARDSSFFLLEALAEKLAGVCLAFAGVKSVRIRITKPAAVRFARSLAVEITRDLEK